jgi:DNA-binding GntR family transcriptional regulator
VVTASAYSLATRWLVEEIETLWLYFNMLHDSGNYSTANEHHQEMFAALRDRNAKAVRAAVRADIDAAFDVLVDLLK